jgi:hypothetical protein
VVQIGEGVEVVHYLLMIHAHEREVDSAINGASGDHCEAGGRG